MYANKKEMSENEKIICFAVDVLCILDELFRLARERSDKTLHFCI